MLRSRMRKSILPFLRGLIPLSAGMLLLLLPSVAAETDSHQIAYDSGYTDGVESGQQDRSAGLYFDFANKKSYQQADHGLDPLKHDPQVCRLSYRHGFEDGYEKGYDLDSGDEVGAVASSPQPDKSQRTLTAARSGPSGGDLRVPEGTEFRIKVLGTLSTRSSKVGDRFDAEVVEDVLSGQNTVIPEGTEVRGSVTHVKRAGRIAGRAQMTIALKELLFDDGSTLPIDARLVSIEEHNGGRVKDDGSTVEAGGSKKEDLKNVGTAAAIGTIIGLLGGGRRGAKVGAGTGAAGGVAGVLITRGRDVLILSETEMVVRLKRPLVVSEQ